MMNTRLFHAGCGAEPGAIDIPEIGYGNPYNYGALKLADLHEAARAMQASEGGGMKRTVPILRLDDVYEHSACKLIKIDVEGMEADVLRGAARVIRAFRPILYVENEFVERSPELIAVLEQLGYDAWWHIVPCFNPGNARGRTDDIFGGAACVNMLCTPAEQAMAVNGLERVASIDQHPRKAA
jgi:FkbM family methyltransferase